MEQKLLLNKLLKRGFTLIEVIVSLLIVSVTFITFSGLLDQNIRSQDMKRLRTMQTQQTIDLITIYTANPMVQDEQVLQQFKNSNLMTKNVGRLGTFQELEVIIFTDNFEIRSKIIK